MAKIVAVGSISIVSVEDGKSGNRVATLTLYKWSATPPTVFPSGTSTYTWETATFTPPANLNGWSMAPGTPTPGQTLYSCSVTYVEGT